VDSRLVNSPTGDPTRVGGCPEPIRGGVGQAHWDSRGRRGCPRRTNGGAANPSRSARGGSHTGARLPPFSHDGTERRLDRPQDPTEQTRCYSGKKTCHTVKNVLLINAALMSLLRSDT
jgi:hypothetical protein